MSLKVFLKVVGDRFNPESIEIRKRRGWLPKIRKTRPCEWVLDEYRPKRLKLLDGTIIEKYRLC